MSPVAAMMLSGAAAGGGGGPGGSSPATITIDHTKAGTADTSNFVMLFSSTNTNWKSTGNGGQVGTVNDFRFASDSGGVTLLNWEIIKWTQTTGQLVARVKVPTLSHTSDTVIYLLWDGTGRGSFLGGSAGAIWDVNYKTVLGWGDGTTLSLADLTTNANNGTNNGGAVAAAGINGVGGISFNAASSQYITTANTLNIAQPTIEMWVNYPSPTSGIHLCGFNQGGGTYDKVLTVESTANPASASWYLFDGTTNKLTVATCFPGAAWTYVVGTDDASNMVLYINGSQVGTKAASNSYTGYTLPGFRVNGNFFNNTFGTYTASEIRVSNLVRSTSYLTATYNSYNSPSTFYTVS